MNSKMRKNLYLRGCFFAFIRQGEVAMCSGNGSNSHDPALTDHGVAQAILTGRHLKKYFESKSMKFDRFIIESAPSIGAIKTASLLA